VKAPLMFGIAQTVVCRRKHLFVYFEAIVSSCFRG